MKKIILIFCFYSLLFADLSIKIENNSDKTLFLSFPKTNSIEKGFFIESKKNLKINIKNKEISDIVPKFYIFNDSKIYSLCFEGDFPLFITDQDTLVFIYDESRKNYVLNLNNELYYFCSQLKKVKQKYLWVNYLNTDLFISYYLRLAKNNLKLKKSHFILFNYYPVNIFKINDFIIDSILHLKSPGVYFFGLGRYDKNHVYSEFYKVYFGQKRLFADTRLSSISFPKKDCKDELLNVSYPIKSKNFLKPKRRMTLKPLKRSRSFDYLLFN
jgi:hypothetical protein